MSQVGGVGLAAMAAGSVMLYGAITGKSPLVAAYSIVRGSNPQGVPQSAPLGTATSTASGGPGNDHARSDWMGGQNATPGGGAGNARFIADRLATHLHNRNAVAGILGNMEIESSLDPTKPNPGEGAIGLCQWEGGRRSNLQAFAASRGTTETDLATQVDFLWHELTGSESATLLPLLASTTPEGAAATFDIMYERSTAESRPAREAAARRWYNTLYGTAA